MQIYFEVAELLQISRVPFKPYMKIDACHGISKNLDNLDDLIEFNLDAIIYTNQIAAMQSKYCWNNKLKLPELYIRAGEHMIFTRIDKLTTKELREEHNLAKMYIAGEFDNVL